MVQAKNQARQCSLLPTLKCLFSTLISLDGRDIAQVETTISNNKLDYDDMMTISYEKYLQNFAYQFIFHFIAKNVRYIRFFL